MNEGGEGHSGRGADRERTRGAVAVMVAVSLVAIFGAAALTVDMGTAWTEKRQLATASDAAALGAGGRYAFGSNGCGVTAVDLVHANDPDATLTGCRHVASGSAGTVEVTLEKDVQYVFAPIIGVNSGTVTETTVIQYGIPSGVGGLRPFGLCVEALSTVAEYQNWNKVDPSAVMVIPYGKGTNVEACNGGASVPGNWGMVNFNGGSQSNAETKAWVANGYPEMLSPGWYVGSTGAFSNSVSPELAALVASGEVFPIPLFTEAMGNGNNAQLLIEGFAWVKLHGFRATGSAHDRYLELQFMTGVFEGQCCDPDGIDMGARVVRICSYDSAASC